MIIEAILNPDQLISYLNVLLESLSSNNAQKGGIKTGPPFHLRLQHLDELLNAVCVPYSLDALVDQVLIAGKIA